MPDQSPPKAAHAAPTTWLTGHGALAAVLVVLVLVALIRLRVADVPLERDEGEYAYAGQLILQGVPPYRLAYNMKFPGTYYAYAAILALFGPTPWGIHVGLLIVNAATTLVLFFLGRRLIGTVGAAVGAAAFAVLSLDRGTLGVFAHSTHFVLLPALAGLLVLLRAMHAQSARGFLAAGVLLGISVLMKQHAVVFLPFGIALAVWSATRQPMGGARAVALAGGSVLAGAAVPFALLGTLLTIQGVLGQFWFWTFQYAREYVSEIPLSAAWSLLAVGVRAVTQASLPVWLLGGVGIVALWLTPWSREARIVLSGLLVVSFLGICPGFYFRKHYFILLLPVVGLLVGVAVVSAERLFGRVLPSVTARTMAVGIFVLAVGGYVVNERDYLFSMSPRQLSRALYGINPFVEAADVARYIRERTTPQERIAVVGSEPEIYFLAGRRSATGHIYTYALMEPQRYGARMQDEMIREIEAARPRYLVFVSILTSWLPRPGSDRRILDWVGRYSRACYDLVGVVDIHSLQETTTRWDGDVPGYRPRSNNVVYTFRRKSDGPCGAGR